MIYKFSDNISWQKMNDYIYIVNEYTGAVYYLNQISKYLWEAIAESMDIEIAIQQLSANYQIDIFQLENDVKNFLAELQKEGLLNEV